MGMLERYQTMKNPKLRKLIEKCEELAEHGKEMRRSRSGVRLIRLQEITQDPAIWRDGLRENTQAQTRLLQAMNQAEDELGRPLTAELSDAGEGAFSEAVHEYITEIQSGTLPSKARQKVYALGTTQWLNSTWDKQIGYQMHMGMGSQPAASASVPGAPVSSDLSPQAGPSGSAPDNQQKGSISPKAAVNETASSGTAESSAGVEGQRPVESPLPRNFEEFLDGLDHQFYVPRQGSTENGVQSTETGFGGQRSEVGSPEGSGSSLRYDWRGGRQGSTENRVQSTENGELSAVGGPGMTGISTSLDRMPVKGPEPAAQVRKAEKQSGEIDYDAKVKGIVDNCGEGARVAVEQSRKFGKDAEWLYDNLTASGYTSKTPKDACPTKEDGASGVSSLPKSSDVAKRNATIQKKMGRAVDWLDRWRKNNGSKDDISCLATVRHALGMQGLKLPPARKKPWNTALGNYWRMIRNPSAYGWREIKLKPNEDPPAGALVYYTNCGVITEMIGGKKTVVTAGHVAVIGSDGRQHSNIPDQIPREKIKGVFVRTK